LLGKAHLFGGDLNYLFHSRVEIKGREIKKRCSLCHTAKGLDAYPLRLCEWWSPDLVLFPWMTHDTCVGCLRQKEKENKVDDRVIDLQTCLSMIGFHNRVADASVYEYVFLRGINTILNNPVFRYARKQLDKQKHKCAKPGCDQPMRFSCLEPVLTASGGYVINKFHHGS
jgi:hypothetical protein